MVVNKRKKNSRQHGSMTHGWGSKKKHRGAGNRGGRGMAGTGKRADAKKPSIWGDPYYFGKHGFKKKNIKFIIKPINLRDLQQRINTLVKDKKAISKGDGFEIDLKDLGYNKLLSCGNLSHKLIIKTAFASKKAVEKTKKSGGDVILEIKKQEKGTQKAEQKEARKEEQREEQKAGLKAGLKAGPKKEQKEINPNPENPEKKSSPQKIIGKT